MGEPSDLAATIVRRIRREGPLTLAAFTAMALHDPARGYYAGHNPLGRAGDFVTAPEISQIFGELIGLWCADFYDRMGRPANVVLAELGPGRGTLMADFLRAAATQPAFSRALKLYLVEVSPILRAEQRRRLDHAKPEFVATLDELPDGPLLLIANEFLDALPIRQLVRGPVDWAERLVAADAADRLVFVDGAQSPATSLLVPPPLRNMATGTVVEICPTAAVLAAALGERLVRQAGAALLIDYGYFPSMAGSTLAAIRRHQPADPLSDPGSADLSAHVDFATIIAAAHTAGALAYGPVPQGQFLTALGAGARLAALSQRATPAQRATLDSGLRRLIEPAQMGTLFKVLSLTSPGLPAPAGFAVEKNQDRAANVG
ncbi:MAG TPA: SAM-dependent methyltransferase [Stellaceae bacterium]|jgi:NADH dehydrogenase [ubiquinone] 1 alpha subcomplex assembly factor 7|nr:SAM-dependent methyltransferase [Stellaceae bacterium]